MRHASQRTAHLMACGTAEVELARTTSTLHQASITLPLKLVTNNITTYLFHLQISTYVCKLKSKELIISLLEKVGFIDSKAPSGTGTPAAFRAAAKKACRLSVKEAKSAYPNIQDSNLPYTCMDLTYHYSLLVDGFGKLGNWDCSILLC
jgi:hypothetical protein